jgi:hypothetical protein
MAQAGRQSGQRPRARQGRSVEPPYRMRHGKRRRQIRLPISKRPEPCVMPRVCAQGLRSRAGSPASAPEGARGHPPLAGAPIQSQLQCQSGITSGTCGRASVKATPTRSARRQTTLTGEGAGSRPSTRSKNRGTVVPAGNARQAPTGEKFRAMHPTSCSEPAKAARPETVVSARIFQRRSCIRLLSTCAIYVGNKTQAQ